MGQRHQIFVKIPNPVNYLQIKDVKERKELEKEFGKKDHTVLAYHHQWLYGRSALYCAIGLLNFGENFTKDDLLTGDAYDCPYSKRGMEFKFNREQIIDSIKFILNYRVKNHPRGTGFDDAWYIGKEDEKINFDYTRGDNNDGITIIDLIEMKYCFMNINENYDEISHSAYDLPPLKPCSASEYVKAYYGETKETVEVRPNKHIDEVIAENIITNAKIVNKFKKFEVLTQKEVNAIFYRMKKQKNLVD